ncbi:hypothetical protein HanIR_Chr16g0842051 [Helianthus annuus]|nr:hypothetical protein HanIR_Chr16g0842051 [Helianthus annuus]
MHPHFKHLFFQTNFITESHNILFILLLDLPLNSFRKIKHLVFLFLSKFRPKPFLRLLCHYLHSSICPKHVKIFTRRFCSRTTKCHHDRWHWAVMPMPLRLS